MKVFLTSFQSKKVMTADIRPSEQLTLWPPPPLSPAPKLSAICLKELPTCLHFSCSWLGLGLEVTRLVTSVSGGGGGGGLSVFPAWLSSP